MSRRFVALIVVAGLTSISLGYQSSAAASPAEKLLSARKARLERRLHHEAFSSSTSSSSSIKMRLTKRRGGGGSHQGSRSSSAQLTTPTITFANITKNYGSADFTLTPVSNSSGAFTFTSSDTSIATINGSTVSIVHAGTTVITAIQQANGNFTDATFTVSLTVNTVAPTIVPLLSITKNSTDLPFLLSDPTSNSAGTFTFTSTNPAVATIMGRTVTIHAAGTTTIISTQAANGDYKSGSGTTILIVNPVLEES